jgi:electron transport complex protein RnfG
MNASSRQTLNTGGRLLLICAVAALGLGALNEVTEPVIESRRIAEQQQVIAQFVTDGTVDEAVLVEENPVVNAYYAVRQGGAVSGYILDLTGTGYGGEMTIFAACAPSGEIRAGRLLDNLETPGLGKKAETPSYMNMFVGTGGDTPVPVTKAMLSASGGSPEPASRPQGWWAMARNSLAGWLFGEQSPSAGGAEAVSGATITFSGVSAALAEGARFVRDLSSRGGN